jgi:predicted anti-sigma-YlaC factor YlaD
MDEKKTLKQRIEWAVIVWLARRLPDCKAITQRMGRALDERPSFRERIIQRLHLFTCAACRRYLEQVKFLKAAFGRAEVGGLAASGPSLGDDARERIKSALRTHS